MFETHKTLTCKAGEWTTIIHTRFAQLPMSWTMQTNAEVTEALGEFHEAKSSWIFPGKPVVGLLHHGMVFNRGYWNTFYKVRIRPSKTITISLVGVWF
jgi:hypothetical protein